MNCQCEKPKIRWVRPVKDLTTGVVYEGRVAEELHVKTLPVVTEEGVTMSELYWRYYRSIVYHPICEHCEGLVVLV